MIILGSGGKAIELSIFDVYVNDFQDDYHAPDTDQTIKALNTKSKYKDIITFLKATEEYNNYMDALIAKYGGEQRFSILWANKLITEKIPSKPTLKSNYHKRLAKKGTIISPVSKENIINEKVLNNYYKQNAEFFQPTDIVLIKKDKKLSKLAASTTISSYSDIYEKKKTNLTLEIDDFFRNNIDDYKSKVIDNGGEGVRLPGLYDIMHRTDKYDDYLDRIAEIEDEERVPYRGSVATIREVREADILSTLKEKNSPFINVISRKASNLVKSTIKKDKKIEKRRKKNEKKRDKQALRSISDDFIGSIMGDMDFDTFEDFKLAVDNY